MSTEIVARCPISIRPATMNDVPFIDKLRGMHSKSMGFMPLKEIEGKINAGHVLIAEESGQHSAVSGQLGYVIAQDRYLKREELGVVYALNVMPLKQRKLIGATLIKASFERAAYGCKLFCCWVAQDLPANHFWESIGFIPLAFRTGARGTGRTHIFWQRRIREGDTTTPYWFPSKTDSGSMREDRLVLPIPPGTHWKDAMPKLLPDIPAEAPALPAPCERREKKKSASAIGKLVPLGGVYFAGPAPEKAVVEKPKKQPKPKVKFPPEHVAAARELRDRYLEQFNSGLVLPNGKYDVSRALASEPQTPRPLLIDRRAA